MRLSAQSEDDAPSIYLMHAAHERDKLFAGVVAGGYLRATGSHKFPTRRDFLSSFQMFFFSILTFTR